MKWIAFSWIQNTGKSTIIKAVYNFLTNEWYTVFVIWEVARKLDPRKNFELFQDNIMTFELERVQLLWPSYDMKNDPRLSHIVYLFDRTFLDNLCYREFAAEQGKCSKLPPEDQMNFVKSIPLNWYDKVFLFDTTIHDSKAFPEYDNNRLKHIFDIIIHQLENVVCMRNGMVNKDEIFTIIKDLLYELPQQKTH